MSAYFVSAVGTGVGKTFTTCALLHAATGRARGFKPIISGWIEDDTSDTAQIIAASGSAQSLAEVSPWRFSAPLSPHLAAAAENTVIAPDSLLEWTRSQLGAPGMTLIEGVGGVMVPLTDRFTTLDWVAQAGLPTILVTGSYLGSISHTLTAIAALRSRNVPIAALILNESDGSTVTLALAEAGLAPFIGDIPLRIVQPRVSSWTEASAIHRLLEQLA